MDTDFILVQKMRLGSESAVCEFVEKYYARILQYCYFHLHDMGNAEDAAQEVFEKLFRHFSDYRHHGKAVNYLYVIAANTCKDAFRKKTEIPVAQLPDQPDSAMSDIELKIDVKRALERMPEELKETAILYFFQGLKIREIAEVLDISVPLVKYRIKKVRELLRRYLGKEEST